jgi:signal peptidase II
VQNTGASFGIFKGHSFTLMIVDIIGIVLLLAMAFYIYRRLPNLVTLLNAIAFSLILAGTVGNLIDRIRLEHVTDFIDVGFWPVFNIADSAVTVGAAIIVFSLIRLTIAESRRST